MDNFKEKWRPAAILAVTASLFYLKDIYSLLWTQKLAGRDLVSNYAFTVLMKNNMLNGELFAWSNQWLLGFPSFELYPPLFFAFVSSLDILTGSILGIKFWFKSIVFLSVFLVPITSYLLFKPVFGKDKAFFAGFYSLIFLFVYKPVSQLYQVFSTGLVAQGLSFLLVLVSIGLMLRDKQKFKIISGVLLGLASITHPFTALTGFLTSGSLFLWNRDVGELVPASIGAVIALPWFLNALQYLPYVSTYSFPSANPGNLLFLLLPLIVIGGLGENSSKALLTTFFSLLTVSLVELPIVTQELRFYTYALSIGSLLAGFGAFRLLRYASQNIDIDVKIAMLALLLPVLGLSVQAEVPKTWQFEGDADPLYNKLESMEQGRVIVETQNSSIYDSFVLQAKIPLETDHSAVNDVHLDSSSSANYILTLESWISSEPLYNPICRTCGTEVSDSVVAKRLDDLGIRYVVVKTRQSKDRMEEFLKYHGKHGDYWLFENTEGYELSQELNKQPVAVQGSHQKWRTLNDRLFVSNQSFHVKRSNSELSIDMRNRSIEEIFSKISSREQENCFNCRMEKYSYSPYRKGTQGTFNLVLSMEER